MDGKTYSAPKHLPACLLKLLASDDTKSHWLHFIDFSPLCFVLQKFVQSLFTCVLEALSHVIPVERYQCVVFFFRKSKKVRKKSKSLLTWHWKCVMAQLNLFCALHCQNILTCYFLQFTMVLVIIAAVHWYFKDEEKIIFVQLNLCSVQNPCANNWSFLKSTSSIILKTKMASLFLHHLIVALCNVF